MDERELKLLRDLCNQRVNWGPGDSHWRDFRDMIPLALTSGLSLDLHAANLGPPVGMDCIENYYSMGVKNWLGARKIRDALKDPVDWSIWLTEYTRALTVSPKAFSQKHPAEIVGEVMDEHHLWNTQLFIVNDAQRLQLALLHIEYHPANTMFHDKELRRWSAAPQSMKEAVDPQLAMWHTLTQDPSLMQDYLRQKQPLFTDVQALPSNLLEPGV